jgi:hypothetical protein
MFIHYKAMSTIMIYNYKCVTNFAEVGIKMWKTKKTVKPGSTQDIPLNIKDCASIRLFTQSMIYPWRHFIQSGLHTITSVFGIFTLVKVSTWNMYKKALWTTITEYAQWIRCLHN